MSTQTNTFQPSPWWLLLLQGIAAIILGILLLANPGQTTVALVVLAGLYWLVSGVFAIIRIFTKAGKSHWAWSLLIGILGILAGIFVLTHRFYSTLMLPTMLVAVIAIEGLAMGVMEILRGAQGDGAGAILIGVLDILIGLWLFFHPMAAALALPFLLGLLGIGFGTYLIYLAFRKDSKAQPQPPPPP